MFRLFLLILVFLVSLWPRLVEWQVFLYSCQHSLSFCSLSEVIWAFSRECTACLVCCRASFIISELLWCRHALREIQFQLATVDARTHCVSKCVGVWNAWHSLYLICVLLPRVDKDRSGVISDSELQQALSNGMYQRLTAHISPSPPSSYFILALLLLLTFLFLAAPLFDLSSFLPSPCYTPLLSTLLWFKLLPSRKWGAVLFLSHWARWTELKWMKFYFCPTTKEGQQKCLSLKLQRDNRAPRTLWHSLPLHTSVRSVSLV